MRTIVLFFYIVKKLLHKAVIYQWTRDCLGKIISSLKFIEGNV